MFDVFYLDKKPGLFPHEQPAQSVEHARQLSRTRFCWVVSYLVDYTGFDFLWEPVPWESHQAHVWPSQHQENSGTWLVPKSGFQDVNRNHQSLTRKANAPRLHIKHCVNTPDQGNVTVRFVSDYLGTMRRALSKTDWEYCWVTADVCDYANFDFSWHPSEWQLDMLHVFASGDQKFGDTFYVHVPSFLEKTQQLKILEWFETLHFVEDCSVPRLPMPTVKYQGDSLAPAVWAHEFGTPLVEFYQEVPMEQHAPVVSLWQEKTRTVMPLNRSHSTAVVPRDAKNYLKTQIYDYPHIDKTKKFLNSRSLDIVFISNGEDQAETLYHHLVKYTVRDNIKRVQNVNGRVAAYQAAARASDTPWFFAVFGKLMVNPDFDWSWQPDYFQQPKHYIFHARNTINGLVYGHQAMIAYNKKLVLENTGQGLDFTLDQPHEVVPLLSGDAIYHTDNWTCWRTAFREALKLRASLPDVENEYRLEQWLTVDASTEQWSMKGAQDAMEYYDQVQGNFDALKKSYEWSWLASYAFMKRGLTPN